MCVCVSGSLTPRIKQEWESLKDETSHLTLNVFKQMLVALEEIEVLEFSVISLGLHQPTLLNIHHLPEAVWERSERLTQTLFQAEESVIALGCLSAQNDTYTCWAGVQSLPCYCVWSIWAEPLWQICPGQKHGSWCPSRIRENKPKRKTCLCFDYSLCLWKGVF